MRPPVRVTIAALALLAGVSVGCRMSDRHYLGDSFPYPIIPVNDEDPETYLRGMLESHWHMRPADVDCMATQALNDDSRPPAQNGWTIYEINAYAATCGVDISKLWEQIEE